MTPTTPTTHCMHMQYPQKSDREACSCPGCIEWKTQQPIVFIGDVATYGGNGDASPEAENFNCIRTTVAPDRDVLIVQVWLKGKPGSWIEYGPSGLDNLIELLQRGRAELREPAKGDAS